MTNNIDTFISNNLTKIDFNGTLTPHYYVNRGSTDFRRIEWHTRFLTK